MSSRFQSPFGKKDVASIQESLNVSVSRFTNLPDAKPQFIEGIQRLESIRNVLLVADASGIMGTIPQLNETLRIFQWLNLQEVTLPWTETPRITTYTELDEDRANSFSTSTQSLLDNLNSQPTYQTASLLLGAIKTLKRLEVEPKLDDLLETQSQRIENQINIYDKKIQDEKTESVKSLNDTADDILKKLNEEYEQKLNSIKTADALKEWQKHYDDLLVAKSSNALTKPQIFQFSEHGLNIDLANFRKRIAQYIKQRFYTDNGYVARARKFSKWKTVWLSSLALTAIANTIYFHYSNSWSYEQDLLQIVSVKAAFALFFGVLYVSANKNYRIYENLVDQTKHRAVVAKTIRSIVLDEKLGQNEEKYKQELVAVGAKAMFELKPIGHLTKKEGSSPLVEIIRDFKT